MKAISPMDHVQVYAGRNRSVAMRFEQRWRDLKETDPGLYGTYIARCVHVDALAHNIFFCDKKQLAGVSYEMKPHRFMILCRSAMKHLRIEL